MKNFKFSIAYLAIFAMIFTSCSKDESSVQEDPNTNMATISFGAVLNDFVANQAGLKAHLDVPVCSDATPVKVRVALKNSAGMWVAGEDFDAGGFIEIPVIPNGEGGWMTKESSDLELPEGMYSLEYFAVLDAGNNILWIAPRENDDYGPANFAAFVNDPLPININLRVGVKKYIDVEVLCYDQRFADEFGYLFFDIEKVQAIDFCIFGNYCDANGRHYPAHYSVNVWKYADGVQGEQLYTDLANTVEMNSDGDYAGSTLCVVLPDGSDLDEYYFEITLLDSDAYGDVPNTIIRKGVINDIIVRNFFTGDNTLDYYHFREGCETMDSPPVFDQEGVTNYKSCLDATNDSGVVALAFFSLNNANNTLNATILATNIEANKVHAQHIHGFADKHNAVCPPSSAAGDDGLISLGEGLPFYGGVLLPLTDDSDNFPTATMGGVVIYQHTFNLGSGGVPTAASLLPLENRAIVIHGKTVNGEYDGSLPVACGELSKTSDY